MSKPNFFIVGMPRAGTTLLHECLGAHPEIYMSYDKKCLWFQGKEPHFFGSDLTLSRSAPPRITQKEYEALFYNVQEKIRGESSTSYLISKLAAEEIYAYNPDAKILISVRNPIDQCYSLYSLMIAGGKVLLGKKKITSFEAALDDPSVLKDIVGWFLDEIRYKQNIFGLLANIERYQRLFGKDRVKIVVFDDIEQQPALLYRSILEFLEVDTQFVPDFSPRNQNISVRRAWLMPFYRWLRSFRFLVWLKRNIFPFIRPHDFFIMPNLRPPLSAATRQQLQREFIPVIERLEVVLGRDLSAWKQRV